MPLVINSDTRMREVLISVRHRGCPVSDTSVAHPEVHIQNLSKGQQADGRAKRLICLRGEPDDIDEFANEFRDHSAVERFEKVAGGDDSSLAYFSSEITFDTENPSILSLIHDKGCFQHSTVSVKRGREHWKVYTEDTQTIHELMAEIEALGNDVTLDRSTDMESLEETQSFDFATFLTDMTPRQRAAFETALSLGYYDLEGDVTTEDVAAALDVHQSTVWEHLEKAESMILTTVGQQLFPEAASRRKNAKRIES